MTSRRNRARAPKPTAAQLEAAILELLEERGEEKTICPSEVARAVASADVRGEWEPLMQPVRDAALRLVDHGRIVVMQRGKVIDGRTAKGPIRFARRGT